MFAVALGLAPAYDYLASCLSPPLQVLLCVLCHCEARSGDKKRSSSFTQPLLVCDVSLSSPAKHNKETDKNGLLPVVGGKPKPPTLLAVANVVTALIFANVFQSLQMPCMSIGETTSTSSQTHNCFVRWVLILSRVARWQSDDIRRNILKTR